ncbi:MAG: 50S ribosomal protein L11 methyltransferase [Actinomycetota bacterium]|nr:50S ribosomal protein L11 methyltransferase [Actinomycetota bacterium]
MDSGDVRRRFVLANTRLRRVPGVPELRLHLADDVTALWERTETLRGGESAPPFWAFAWPGGQAVARHILDHPETVSGRSVLDLATGSGLCAVAAARSGASRVVAVDVDPLSAAAVEVNSEANGVRLDVEVRDLLSAGPPDVDLVLAGDISYERPMAERMFSWLQRCRRARVDVLVGDPGRAFLPRHLLQEVAGYELPTEVAVENVAVRRASVFRIP